LSPDLGPSTLPAAAAADLEAGKTKRSSLPAAKCNNLKSHCAAAANGKIHLKN